MQSINLRHIFIPLLALFITSFAYSQKEYTLLSPDKQTKIIVREGNRLTYEVSYAGKQLVTPSAIHLFASNVNDKPLVGKKATTKSIDSIIVSPVPEKRKFIKNRYEELSIQFTQALSLQFRAYDDGVAYRWLTHFKDSIIIRDELSEYNFPSNHRVYFSAVYKRNDQDSFHTSFEEPYQVLPMDSVNDKHLIFSPLLIAPASGPKILLTESDLEDYPGMFLTGSNQAALKGKWASYPLSERIAEGEFPQAIVTARAAYIARTKGTRSYPWRVMVIAPHDKDLPGNDIVYRLAAQSRIADPSWINPGQGTDEWIIGINLFNVPFKAGLNTATYKFYIDFAKRFGFERIMMDAGWSDNKDLFKINPDINMDEIAAYAKNKGIKLSMWTLAMTLDKQLEPALEQFNKWGVDFIMTDFMDRDDQKMVNFYYRIAEACAKHKLMVMFHGAFKPAGFGRTYPNAVTREGVLGSEYNIWSDKATPQHNLLLPYIRMVSGPMDYEPGILDNATRETFRSIGSKVMAPGTRCHQLAMFVVYESPIQIFAGNPSQGYMEPRFMELLGSIPTTWDETIVLDGKLGEYVLMARKKGDDWFIGAMNNWTARNIDLDLSFLPGGEFVAEICRDGINADRYASDYVIESQTIQSKDKMKIEMAPGGGWIMRLRKK